MKTFLKTVKSSIFDPHFYRGLIAEKKSGFGYFFKLITVLTLFFTIAVGINIIPAITPALNKLGTHAVTAFPAELIVKVKNGEVSTNVKEPYMIPNPGDPTAMKYERANIVVIDTKAEPGLAALEKYDTYVLVTKHAVVFRDDQKSQVRIQDLSAFGGEEFEISRAVVDELVKKAIPFIKFIAPLLLILVYIVSFIGNMALLLYALFGALIVMLVLSMRNHKIAYGHAYNIALYLMTLPMIVNDVWGITSMFVPKLIIIPFLFTLVFILMATLNLKPAATVSHQKAEHPSA